MGWLPSAEKRSAPHVEEDEVEHCREHGEQCKREHDVQALDRRVRSEPKDPCSVDGEAIRDGEAKVEDGAGRSSAEAGD